MGVKRGREVEKGRKRKDKEKEGRGRKENEIKGGKEETSEINFWFVAWIPAPADSPDPVPQVRQHTSRQAERRLNKLIVPRHGALYKKLYRTARPRRSCDISYLRCFLISFSER